MSIAALNFALSAKTKSSSSKLILIILANFSNEDGTCYPSAATLANMSGLDRKTVFKALTSLCDEGIIVQTGQKIGATCSVNVYRILINGAEKDTKAVPKTEQLCQGEAVPFFPISSTVFPYKQYQKRYTEPLGTIREPNNIDKGAMPCTQKNKITKSKNTDNDSQLPDWLPKAEWQRFLTMRKEKKCAATPSTQEGLIKKLAKLKDAGNDPAAVLEKSIESGYRGVFPITDRPAYQIKPQPVKQFSKTL